MITFTPKPVPLLSAIKMLFTRTCYLAVVYDDLGNPKRAGICYEKPKGADPYGDEEREDMDKAFQQAREALEAIQVDMSMDSMRIPPVPYTGPDIRPREATLEEKHMLGTAIIGLGHNAQINATIQEIVERKADSVVGIDFSQMEDRVHAALVGGELPPTMPQFSTRYAPPVDRKKNRKERRQERRKNDKT